MVLQQLTLSLTVHGNEGSLGYLDAVVREVLRLHPTFGSTLMRVASKDVMLGNYKVITGGMFELVQILHVIIL
jgi:cytochrome P450